MFAFWRTFLGIKTKKGNFSSVDITTQKKGSLPSYHPFTDAVGYSAHEDGSTSVDIEDSNIINDIINNKKTSFKLVLTPWHVNIIGRFLGKMGLEFLSIKDKGLVLSNKFDKIRKYIRFSSINKLWTFYIGQQGNIKELKGELINKGDYFEQDIFCYGYALGILKQDEYMFAFNMGTDVWLISLTKRETNDNYTKYIKNIKLKPIYYYFKNNRWY